MLMQKKTSVYNLNVFLFCFVFNRISAVTKGIIELIEDDTKIGEVFGCV